MVANSRQVSYTAAFYQYNRVFLQTLLHYLQPNGDFYFSSDVADYAHDVAGHLGQVDGFENRLNTPMALELAGYPLSKYMRRFLAQNQSIHFIHQRKSQRHTCAATPPPSTKRGFRAAWSCHHG